MTGACRGIPGRAIAEAAMARVRLQVIPHKMINGTGNRGRWQFYAARVSHGRYKDQQRPCRGVMRLQYAEDFEQHFCPACGVEFKELEVGATGNIRKIY